jgi:hypothetical protein
MRLNDSARVVVHWLGVILIATATAFLLLGLSANSTAAATIFLALAVWATVRLIVLSRK